MKKIMNYFAMLHNISKNDFKMHTNQIINDLPTK